MGYIRCRSFRVVGAAPAGLDVIHTYNIRARFVHHETLVRRPCALGLWELVGVLELWDNSPKAPAVVI